MNVSLQGARRQARLDWDAIEERNQRSMALPRKIFMGVAVVVLAYLLWHSIAA